MIEGKVKREGLDAGRWLPCGGNLRKPFSHCLCFCSRIGKRVQQEEEEWSRHLEDECVNGLRTGGKPPGQPSGPTLV